jgi:hypothetical protein
MTPGEASDKTLSDDQAIEIARQATKGLVDVPDDAEAVVDKSAPHYVVTFPIHHPPGMRGADFYAQVSIDPQSGKVERILGGH